MSILGENLREKEKERMGIKTVSLVGMNNTKLLFIKNEFTGDLIVHGFTPEGESVSLTLRHFESVPFIKGLVALNETYSPPEETSDIRIKLEQ